MFRLSGEQARMLVIGGIVTVLSAAIGYVLANCLP